MARVEDEDDLRHIPMVEDYISQLPMDDQAILTEHYLPVKKIIKGMQATLSGASKTNAEVLEDAVRERCVDVPEKRIRKIVKILTKAIDYMQPRILEKINKSGRLQSGTCVPGSNCHYTKKYLLETVKFFANISQPSDGKGNISINLFNVHTDDKLSATKVISPIDLVTYSQMKIIELVPGIVNTNKVIYCTLVVDGHIMGSFFHTVVEDDFGQCAKLSLRNITPELQDFLKKGIQIAIPNPYYKLGTTDELNFIRMDCPANIIPIKNDLTLSESEEIYNQEDLILNHSSEDCKLEGNNYFKAGEYYKAVSCYTIAIAKDSSNPVYLSNRALCYLKLDSFEDALQDAEAAVSLDPSTHKYQYRLAMAWSALGDHQKSVEILETMQANSECLAFLSKEKKLLNNSRGIFNFDEMAQKARRGEELEIADFIGPIMIDKSSRYGHGVFSARDIKKGELICVQKAIAYLDPNRHPLKDYGELIIFANHISISPTNTIQRMKRSLTDKIAKSKLSEFRLSMLFTKHTNSEPISTELYRSKGYELIREKDKPPFQMDALVTLIKENSQVYSHPDDPHNEEMITVGIWPIRAFLNHSCLANTLQTYYKDVCIIRSFVDIPKGTELTTQWVSILFNVEARQAKLKELGLFCDCGLCEFESDPKNTPLLERAVLLRERVDKLTDTKFNPNYPFKHEAENDLLNEAFSLAEEMKLGPTRFNRAVWEAMLYLLSSSPKPRYHKRLLDSFYRAKSILCDLEIQHQHDFWKTWCLFIRTCKAPLSKERKKEIRDKHKFIIKYLTDIP